jgi:hypothetical protein
MEVGNVIGQDWIITVMFDADAEDTGGCNLSKPDHWT